MSRDLFKVALILSYYPDFVPKFKTFWFSGRRRPPQAMTEEEDSELQAAIQESLNDVRQGSNELSSHSSSSMMDRSNIPNHEPSSEEIRQLRLRRFQR